MNSGSIGKDDVEIVDTPSHIETLPKPSHVTEIGTFRVVGLNPEDEEFYTTYPEEKRKKVFHKVSTLSLQGPSLILIHRTSGGHSFGSDVSSLVLDQSH